VTGLYPLRPVTPFDVALAASKEKVLVGSCSYTPGIQYRITKRMELLRSSAQGRCRWQREAWEETSCQSDY